MQFTIQILKRLLPVIIGPYEWCSRWRALQYPIGVVTPTT
jgi:hypothetical protein